MLAGYYTIASGMLTRQRELDTIGNNLINVQTPGYRADRLLITSFEQELLTRQEKYNTQTLGNGKAATSGVVDDVVSLFHSGTLQETGRTMDLAINGEGFFQVRGEDGAAYLTRNGQFDIDQQGYLTLPGVGRVVGQNGPIHVEDESFSVEPNGAIYNRDGRQIGKLKIIVPPENAALTKLPNGMFQSENSAQANANGDYTILQGKIERSNVDMNQEMTTLIESQRGFQACSSALQTIDALNRKAASQIAAL